MGQTVLNISGITKQYHKKAVLSDVNLTIKRGMIYGLIGENGAGKSTLMRVIMGLISADEGEIELFGEHDRKKLQVARKKIGQSIEMPALYPELTAQQNMMIQAVQGGVGTTRIDELLALVNLQLTGNKKAKNFSLGMKQRLAIAMTLVTNPEFLILDEPTNGLDPSGIVESREILRKLVRDYGMTVLISSHLLSELSEIATHYGILHQGKIIKELSKKQLELETQSSIELTVDEPKQALPILDAIGITDYLVAEKNQIQIFGVNQRVGEINRLLVTGGVEVTKLMVVSQTLETYFIQLVGGKK